jgi:hypothetical protein
MNSSIKGTEGEGNRGLCCHSHRRGHWDELLHKTDEGGCEMLGIHP